MSKHSATSTTWEEAEASAPMARQFLQIKRQFPDAIVFFRLGDFYETFNEDAQVAAQVLNITLTSRKMAGEDRWPMAGVPHHAVNTYLTRMVRAGYKCAIVEQMEEPNGKLVERAVTRVLTPGTLVEPNMLDARRNNYLAALVLEGEAAGLAYCDVTTGEFAATQLHGKDLLTQLRYEMERLQPAEVLVADRSPTRRPVRVQRHGAPQTDPLLAELAYPFSPYPAWRFDLDTGRQALLDHFKVGSLDGFGLGESPLAIRAAGAILAYVYETHLGAIDQLINLTAYTTSRYMALDPATRRNLEITQGTRSGNASGSLLGVLDQTATPMGSRLLRAWLSQPLLEPDAINARLDAVAAFYDNNLSRGAIAERLKGLNDLERLTNRVIQRIATPRDLLAICKTLEAVPGLLEALGAGGESASRAEEELTTDSSTVAATSPSSETAEEIWESLGHRDATPAADAPQPRREHHREHRRRAVIREVAPSMDLTQFLPVPLAPCVQVVSLIRSAIVPEPPAALGTPGIIAPGFSAELDGIIHASRDAKDWVASLEARERERSGIKSLKVGFNKVFGYYLEVTKANADAVPADYIRKQTLVNAERYITPELKEYETLILNAEERVVELETRLFRDICAQIADEAQNLLGTARAIAYLDVVTSLAEVARRHTYVRPVISTDGCLDIRNGRHPVVERSLEGEFVANDLRLEEGEIVILTGPNMAGKCVRGDTLVFTNRGLLPIIALMPPDAQEGEFTGVSCLTQGRQGRQDVTHFYVGGRQATVRIKTRFGYQIEGTPKHRIWVRHPDGTEGWKALGDVLEGDVAAIQRRIDLWGHDIAIDSSQARALKRVKQYPLPETLDPDLAYLMGLLIGDGTLTYDDSFLLSTADAFIADEFTRIMQRLFSYTPGRKANGKDFFVTSHQIRKFLADLDMGYNQAQDKHVPVSILRAPKPLVVAFLQGLFDTDGYADNRYGNAHLATASKRLAHEVQLLLLNLGIIASLRVKQTPARPSYEVSITGLDAIMFHQLVGFRLLRKKERAGLASSLRMPNVGGIPYLADTLKEVQARIVSTPNKPVALKRVKSINSIFYTYIPTGRNLTHGKLDELVAYCRQNDVPCPELDTLQTTRYFYDPVTSTEAGEAEVYDLSVAEEHAYVANGLISHNSTYLRQIALVVLMAQIGSFVPAESATLSVVDRIFTRIGAHDEIAQGQSTFMVEMVETANILRHATPRSLVVLDEVGRGTSTYDGLSIAWAVVEYLHNNPDLRAKTLFATHYHELTELAERLPRVRNYNVAVAEDGDGVVFLHKIVPGGADRSYGIHVAQLAGLPRAVIHRASEILADLEQEARAPGAPRDARPMQLALLMTEHPAVTALKELDVNQLTPLEAINALYQLQKKAKE